MQSRGRIAIVGVGTIGAQTLWRLAKRGAEVHGYDLAHPGHDGGAAGGSTRLFRRVEPEHIETMPFVEQADRLWRELEDESGIQLRELTGAVVIGSEGTDLLNTAIKSAVMLGDQARVYSRVEAASVFPEYRLSADEVVIHDRGAGIIYPELSVLTAAKAAVAAGAVMHKNAEVTNIVPDGFGYRVESDRGSEYYDRVVIAAGPWTAKLLPEFRQQLLTRRLLSAWHQIKDDQEPSNFLPFYRLAPRFAYGLPDPDGRTMKLGVGFDHHTPVEQPQTEGDRFVPEVTPTTAVVDSLFPGLEELPIRTHAYYEAYTADRKELITQHPKMGGVIVCAGFSGKGFKTAPAYGEYIAQLVLDLL